MSHSTWSERHPTRLNPADDLQVVRPSNIPARLTPLLGRHEELAGIRSMLDRDGVRLLALTGPGGTGKTRLALEVASRMQHDFAHGVFLVSLASVRDPGLVPAAMAQALGIRESNQLPVADVLTTALRAMHMLLVLDNMEHVIAIAPWLETVLAICPRITILVTSRRALRISGEHRFPVPPLPVPVDVDRSSVESLSDCAAVNLFVQRARAVNPAFVLDDANAATIARICQRLDGLPLAIELAAARINVLSPASILDRLSNLLPLLRRANPAAPGRHRTMHDAIAWSHDLLSLDEKVMFRRLAVFSGGVDLNAIEQIVPDRHAAATGSGSEDHVLDVVASLVDQSLLQSVPGGDGELRFRMLETIREFGLELLAADDDAGEVRRRHAACFLSLAENAEPSLHGPDQVKWMDRLQVERANLRAALAWAIEQGEADLGLRLAHSLWWFWWVRGEFSEGLATLDSLLALPAASAPTSVRGRALVAAGVLAMVHAPDRDIEAMYREGLAIARETNDQAGIAQALLSLGFLAMLGRGPVDQASSFLEQSREIFRQLDHRWGQAAAGHFLGRLAFAQGDLVLARRHLEEALASSRSGEDQHGIASSFLFLGLVMEASGDNGRARVAFREAVQRYAQLGDRGILVSALEGLAGVLGASGEAQLAAHLFGGASSLRQLIGAPVPPAERPKYDRDLNLVRTALGDAGYSSARSAGEAMSIHETVAMALADPANAPAPPPVASHIGAMPAPCGLSPRELEVLRLLSAGMSSRDIANALSISQRTASTHASNILGKIGVSSRTAAVAFAIRHGIA